MFASPREAPTGRGGERHATMASPFLWFALVSVIWGTTFAAARIAVQHVPPILLSGVRYLVVFALLAPTVGGLGRAFGRDLRARVLISGALAIAGTYGFLFWGIRTTPSGLAGLVNLSIIPVGLFGLAILTGEEKPSWRLAGALALGLAGLVIVYRARLGSGEADASGLSAIVVGTLSYCVGSVLARPLLRELDAMTLTAAHALIGGTLLTAASVMIEPVDAAALRAFAGWPVLLSLAFLTLAGTIVAYTLYLRLMVTWGTARAGLYAFVSPVVALVVGRLAFGEPIGLVEAAGAVLLLGAAALASFRRRPAAAATPPDPRPGSPSGS